MENHGKAEIRAQVPSEREVYESNRLEKELRSFSGKY